MRGSRFFYTKSNAILEYYFADHHQVGGMYVDNVSEAKFERSEKENSLVKREKDKSFLVENQFPCAQEIILQ